MDTKQFKKKLMGMSDQYNKLIALKNCKIEDDYNGVYNRYFNPIITNKHIPLHWRFDLNEKTNPLFLERIGFNSTFNAGAIKIQDKYLLVVRVEMNDRKSIFAVAESDNGVDNFRFWDRPLTMPQTEEPDTNVYDMRVVKHEDGWIYGLFCTERKDKSAPVGDTVMAESQCGIARTKDLKNWERLPDLVTYSGQQRNVVLHPEFVDGKYALYTRPQDGFIDTGSGGGIGFGYTNSMINAEVKNEVIINQKMYQTIYEAKNGLGPAPIKTERGWLHLAHGVRNTAAGLRYVLYVFMTDLNNLKNVIYAPGGYLFAPNNSERIGDVSNVLFSNGWLTDEDGKIYIYYASSDTRMHVATSTIEQMVDYCINTPEDSNGTFKAVENVNKLIDGNIGMY